MKRNSFARFGERQLFITHRVYAVWARAQTRLPARAACGLPAGRLVALLVALVVCGCQQQPRPPVCALAKTQAAPRLGYSFSCWLNGWRKLKTDQSPDVLAIQASGYSFALNLADFSKAAFSSQVLQPVGYAEALQTKTDDLCRLPPAELRISVDMNGEHYRAVSCAAGTNPDPGRLGAAKMWESGRFVQHFELADLRFESPSGKP